MNICYAKNDESGKVRTKWRFFYALCIFDPQKSGFLKEKFGRVLYLQTEFFVIQYSCKTG